ncbi:MAG: HAD family phosphatase [Eubacterium aggregans]|uniref:Haloacid dehalogenase superfamily, subfamily IA, variant 3 with third motif having DD or ED n=1 Tax=Eubacterium aggregans TaxID=81409 RepID=A0A1H4BES0_9FIRM|nr:HAD family phosphatase [Eubacterium aggregans]MEA5073055.1 HAD family phosphatase [Eubacterium aggregans]SEA46673.1 haloacid dehalogenase superfamily, subfamily IA, variant 3 with third motif having DD or ED [Eubacterium aggregans]
MTAKSISLRDIATPITGVIFDLDGTLLDSMPIWATIASDYLRSQDIQPEPGLDQHFMSLSMAQGAAHYRDHYGLVKPVDQIITEVCAMVYKAYATRVPLKPGAYDFLTTLHAAGIPTVIATASERDLIDAALAHHKLTHCIDHILTCSEVGCGKDCPEVFEAALALLGTSKKSTLVFEDAYHAIKTATGAGFTVVAVADDSAAADTGAIQALCPMTIHTFKELL